MDFLKQELERQKKNLADKKQALNAAAAAAASSTSDSSSSSTTNTTTTAAPVVKKFLKRAEIEQLEEQERIRQQQERDAKKRKIEHGDVSNAVGATNSPLKTKKSNQNQNNNNKDHANKDEEEEVQFKPLPKDEVIRRLRVLNQPITYFGESDMERQKRMHQLELLVSERLTGAAGSAHSQNTFQQIMQNSVRAEIEAAIAAFSSSSSSSSSAHGDDDNQPTTPTSASSSSAATKRRDADSDSDDDRDSSVEPEDGKNEGDVVSAIKNLGASVSDSNKKEFKNNRGEFAHASEFVLAFLKRVLHEWEDELEARPEAEKRTAQGKYAKATWHQTRQYLKPLLKMLKKKNIAADVLKSLEQIVQHALDREYVSANDIYLQLAIGNAPWPMGVSMAGIHERSGRDKLMESKIAHILNDETQRKYIQSLKRLLTYAQHKYPHASNVHNIG